MNEYFNLQSYLIIGYIYSIGYSIKNFNKLEQMRKSNKDSTLLFDLSYIISLITHALLWPVMVFFMLLADNKSKSNGR